MILNYNNENYLTIKKHKQKFNYRIKFYFHFGQKIIFI